MSPLDRRRFLHLSAAAGMGVAAAGVVGYSALQPDDGAWTRWLPDQPEATSDTENGTFRGYRLGASDYTDIRRYESDLPAEFFDRYRDMFGRIPGPEFEAIRRFVNLPSGVVVTGDFDRSTVEGRFEGGGGGEDRPFDFAADGTYRGFSVYVSQSSSLGAAVGDRAVVYGPTPSGQPEDATAPTYEAVIDSRFGDRPRYYTDDPVALTVLRRLDETTLFSLVDWRREGDTAAADGRVGEDGTEVLLAGQSTTIRGERTDLLRLRVYPDAVAADEADRDEWKREVREEAGEVEGLSVSRTGRLLELTGTRPTDSL